MRWDLKSFLLSCVGVSSAIGLSGPVAAGEIGSGTVSGLFSDSESVAELSTFFTTGSTNPAAGEDWAVPTAGGAGTSTYQWGLFPTGVETSEGAEIGPSDNLLSFDGSSFVDQPKGDSFVGGTLTYTNGVSQLGTEVSSAALTLNSTSSDPDFEQTLPLEIGIETTLNVSTGGVLNEEASADFIYFLDYPELGSFRVYEGQTTSVDVLMAFNSLDLVGFGDVDDPSKGFVSESVAGGSVGALRNLDDGDPTSDIGDLELQIHTTTDLVSSGSVANMFVQDATGGVAVFGTTAFIAGLLEDFEVGDVVRPVGFEKTSFNGLLELVDDPDDGFTAFFESVSSAAVAATVVTADAFADFSVEGEDLEGSLVTIQGVSFAEAGTFAGLQNYTVTQNGQEVEVRVSTTDLDLVGTEIPTDLVNLTGVLSQFDTSGPAPGTPGVGYQLLLRSTSDIVVVPEPSAVALAVLVAGAWGPVRRR